MPEESRTAPISSLCLLPLVTHPLCCPCRNGLVSWKVWNVRLPAAEILPLENVAKLMRLHSPHRFVFRLQKQRNVWPHVVYVLHRTIHVHTHHVGFCETSCGATCGYVSPQLYYCTGSRQDDGKVMLKSVFRIAVVLQCTQCLYIIILYSTMLTITCIHIYR